MTAAKRKALIWREWRLTRKSFFMGLIVCFSLLGFFWLVRLSMSVGNLAPFFSDSEIVTEFSGLLYYAAVALSTTALLSAFISDNTVLLADMNSNWLRYSFALPIPAKTRATVSYIVKLGKVLVAVLLLIPSAMLSAKINGQEFSPYIIWFILVATALTLTYDTLLQIFISAARTVKQYNAAQAKVFGVLLGLMFFWMFYKMSRPQSEDALDLPVLIEKAKDFLHTHGNIICPLTVILLIACPALGWLICVRNNRQFGDVKEEAAKEKAGLFSFAKKQKTGDGQ